MVWKPKEKPLTLEEALQLAKTELSPYWYGSQPLIAGYKNEEKYTVVPLVPEFSKKTWLLSFFDITSFEGEEVIQYLKEWNHRYCDHQMGFLGVVSPRYEFLKDREATEKIIKDHQIDFPVMLDLEEAVEKSFISQMKPRVVLLHHGRRQSEYSEDKDFESIELDIQNFLRSMDPGLPLAPLYMPLESSLITDQRMIEFGTLKNPTLIIQPSTGSKLEKFQKDELIVSGIWQQDLEKITTSDSNAMIGLQCSSKYFSVIASCKSKLVFQPKISIEIDGQPPYESIMGPNLVMDDSGQSMIKVVQAQNYQALVNMPPMEHEIILRFPNADSAPVSLYGLRLGD